MKRRKFLENIFGVGIGAAIAPSVIKDVIYKDETSDAIAADEIKDVVFTPKKVPSSHNGKQLLIIQDDQIICSAVDASLNINQDRGERYAHINFSSGMPIDIDAIKNAMSYPDPVKAIMEDPDGRMIMDGYIAELSVDMEYDGSPVVNGKIDVSDSPIYEMTGS